MIKANQGLAPISAQALDLMKGTKTQHYIELIVQGILLGMLLSSYIYNHNITCLVCAIMVFIAIAIDVTDRSNTK